MLKFISKLLKKTNNDILFLVTVKNKKGKVFSMARQDNVKIITTALLVVLLLSSFIFGFVYRNEIYLKFQSISKQNNQFPEERIIEKEPAWTPPTDKTKVDEMSDATTKKTDLAEIPSLDEMEDDFKKPSTSISVTQPNTLKKNKKSETSEKSTQPEIESESKPSLNEKINRIEETIAEPKAELPKKKAVVKTGQTKKYTAYKKPLSKQQKVAVSSSQKKKLSKVTAVTTSSGNLAERMKSMESKFILQNRKNDERFTEIEKRIEKLEKSLGTN